MSSKVIRWGILGTSYISEVMAKAIHESSTGELTSIGSRSFSTAKLFSEKFSIPTFYGDYQSLLNDKNVDAVYIGLPNYLHKEWILRAAAAKKHILCEKPFVISTDECYAVNSAVNHCQVIALEALMYRFHPLTKKLQELLLDKIIGDVRFYVATYTANIAALANPTAGGSIRNLGCYPISLIRLLTKTEPIEIIGTGRMNQKTSNDSQASAILKFDDNVMAVVSTADDINMFWQFDIYGSDGCLKMVTNPWLPDKDNKIHIFKNKQTIPDEIIVKADKNLYSYQIDNMGDAIFKNSIELNSINLQDSLGNIIVLEAWLGQLNKFSKATAAAL